MSILNILNMLYNLHFFSSKCRLFHNATLFGFCITHILNTGCAKILKKIRRQKVKLCNITFCDTPRHTVIYASTNGSPAFGPTQITKRVTARVLTDKKPCDSSVCADI